MFYAKIFQLEHIFELCLNFFFDVLRDLLISDFVVFMYDIHCKYFKFFSTLKSVHF